MALIESERQIKASREKQSQHEPEMARQENEMGTRLLTCKSTYGSCMISAASLDLATLLAREVGGGQRAAGARQTQTLQAGRVEQRRGAGRTRQQIGGARVG